jgi:DNA-binding NtrC family response regulator
MATGTLLLVGSRPDVLAARRVVLEGAGYSVRMLAAGESARADAEQVGASLIMIDVAAPGSAVRAALDELSAAETPSSIPVLIVGQAAELEAYEGPVAQLPKPAPKRALLSSARTLIEGRRRAWTKKRT